MRGTLRRFWAALAETLAKLPRSIVKVPIALRGYLLTGGTTAARPGLVEGLVADGGTVVDVPAKLSARAHVFATGQGRKTDPVDARSVAVVALRTEGLRQVVTDDTTVALRLLVDRRDQLGRARTDVVSRCTTCYSNWCPAARKRTCPPSRPAPCWARAPA